MQTELGTDLTLAPFRSLVTCQATPNQHAVMESARSVHTSGVVATSIDDLIGMR